jgi:hypothetical protein
MRSRRPARERGCSSLRRAPVGGVVEGQGGGVYHPGGPRQAKKRRKRKKLDRRGLWGEWPRATTWPQWRVVGASARAAEGCAANPVWPSCLRNLAILPPGAQLQGGSTPQNPGRSEKTDRPGFWGGNRPGRGPARPTAGGEPVGGSRGGRCRGHRPERVCARQATHRPAPGGQVCQRAGVADLRSRRGTSISSGKGCGVRRGLPGGSEVGRPGRPGRPFPWGACGPVTAILGPGAGHGTPTTPQPGTVRKKSRSGPLYHLSHGQREPDGLDSLPRGEGKSRANRGSGTLAAHTSTPIPF